MGSADIQEFTEALGRRAPRPAAPARAERVSILGGGDLAQALAAFCLSEGADVTLFSAYRREMEPLRAAGGITIRGEGPVGTYRVGSEGGQRIRLSAELDGAVSSADVVVVTGPVLKQRTYAMVLAGHLRDGQAVVLAPGRTFGALEASWCLRAGGDASSPLLVELGAPPFWVAREGAALRLSAAPPAPAGAVPAGNPESAAALARHFPNIRPAPTALEGTFSDASGAVEAVALLGGGPAMPDAQGALMPGAGRLPENGHFRGLLGERHLRVIDLLLEERRRVAARFGVRELPDTPELVGRHAGAEGGPGTRPIPADPAATLRDAVTGSLVPLASAAALAGVAVPLTEAMVGLAQAALGGDLANSGRRLERLGIAAADPEAARRQVAAAMENGF